jgi:hypothetical protein
MKFTEIVDDRNIKAFVESDTIKNLSQIAAMDNNTIARIARNTKIMLRDYNVAYRYDNSTTQILAIPIISNNMDYI